MLVSVVKIPSLVITLILVVALVVSGAVVSWLLLRRAAPARPVQRARWPTIVSTLAGAGTPGLAEGRGDLAAFADPFGIAVDAEGNTYLADAGDNNLIWKIDPNGAARVLAGGQEGFADGEQRSAAFNTPSGVAIDAAGNLFVADTGNDAIRRVSPGGAVTTVAGNGAAGNADGAAADARFNGPIGVAVGRDGRLIVADTYNDSIREITRDGRVQTIAGGSGNGYRDGDAMQALFDTPSGVAIDDDGVIFVADTGNDAIRRIGPDRQVTTIGVPGRVGSASHDVDLFRPVGIAAARVSAWPPPPLTPAASTTQSETTPGVFVTDGGGRVIAVSAAGDATVLAGSPPIAPRARLRNPTGIAVARDGTLRLADSDNYLVRRLTRPDDRVPAADIDFTPVPLLTAATLNIARFPWPLDPQHEPHEVAATLGEARGSPGGDGRERFHTGIDVRGFIGTIVRAVRDEKMERPIGASSFGTAIESVRTGVVSYVHVRVGRTASGVILDPSRFVPIKGELGRTVHIRIRRGTRFRVGDALGTVNNFAHVHLNVGPGGAEINPLSLPLEGFADHIAPTILPKGIELYSETGVRIAPPRKGPVPVSGRVAVVVEAYDRVDGNGAKRKLGVYQLGYQVLREDGTPAPGFEAPRTTIRFDRLPAESGAPHLIYADGSGITVYGNKTTRFRYIVTNSVCEGHVEQGLWDTSQLPAADYRLRVFAADWSGNETTRDLAVRVQ